MKLKKVVTIFGAGSWGTAIAKNISRNGYKVHLWAKEKEVVGVYISGHPLDDYRLEIDNFVNSSFNTLKNMKEVKGKDLRFAAVVTAVEHRESSSGKKYGVVNLEDYTDSFRLFLFGTDYTDFKNLLTEGWVLFIQGRVQEKKWGDTDQLELKVNKIEIPYKIKNRRLY